MPRGIGVGARRVACCLGEILGRTPDRADIVLIGWRRLPVRMKGRTERLRGVLQGGALLVLVGGDQAAQRQSARNLGQRGQALGGLVGLFERRRQNLYIVAAGLRIALQLAVGLDGRRVRSLQIDRVEVERQMQQ